MILYHGSDHVIEKPQYGLGKTYNDYGQGFYCTERLDMAKEWGVGVGHDGFANEYQLDTAGLQMVDLNAPGNTALDWLAVLLQNRWFDLRSLLANEARSYLIEHFSVDLSGADIVKGYRADDSYFAFAQDFISGSISLRQLERAMHLGELGVQLVVKSKRAFGRLRFLRAHEAPGSLWLPRREQRDRDARRAYFDHERNVRRKGDLFIAQIIDEGMVHGDARIQ